MKKDRHLYSYPIYYEVGFCDTRLQPEINFLLESYRANMNGASPKSLLDNGCGTGLHLEKFAKLKMTVTGYDASAQMVEYAASRLARLKAEAHVFHGDLRDFRTSRRSDMAICMNGSFQYLMTVDDVVRHLRCVASALKKHGLYLISLPAPRVFVTDPPGSIVSRWSRSRKRITVDVDWTYRQHPIDWPTQTFAGLARITVRDKSDELCLWMPYKYRIFYPQEIHALVALSRRFELVQVYGDSRVDRIYSKMREPKAMNVLLRKM